MLPSNVFDIKTSTGLSTKTTKWDSFTTPKHKVNLLRSLTFSCFRIFLATYNKLRNCYMISRKVTHAKGVVNYNNDVVNRQQKQTK